jgi:hypothetical protein
MGSLNSRQMIGIVGSVILFVGVFAPIIGIPNLGSSNYFQAGMCNGIAIFLLAIASAILSIKGFFKGLWFTGLASFGILVITLFNIRSGMAEYEEFIRTNKAARELNQMLNQAMGADTGQLQFQWGWVVLVAGAATILVAAALKEKS